MEFHYIYNLKLYNILQMLGSYFLNLLFWKENDKFLTSCWILDNRPWLAISVRHFESYWKQSTNREKAKQTLSTDFLSWWVSLALKRGRESWTRLNSSERRFWQQLAVIAKAARCALIEKKSRYMRHAATPLWNKKIKNLNVNRKS